MMENIESVIDAISTDRGIDKERVELALRLAFIKTGKDVINWRSKFDVDFSSGEANLYEILTVVGNGYRYNAKDAKNRVEGAIRLNEAIEKFEDSELQVGDEIKIPHDLSKFGRYGADALSKNIERQIDEFKGNSLYFRYKNRIGEKIQAKVVHVDSDETTILDINDEDVKAVIKRRDRIKGEKYQVGEWISAVIKYIKIDKEVNKLTVELSRTNIKYLESLFHLAVPEIKDGLVNLNAIARIPGDRAKIAVSSNNPKVDPISAVIGAKGSRVNSVSSEVKNEVIDCVNYSPIPEVFIKNSLSPATVENIKLTIEEDEEGAPIQVAYVNIDKTERGKAIGRGGVNLRLARMLTGYDIRLLTVGDDDNTPEKSASADEVLGALFK
jgi:N utilization substance protein A